jgi:GntR family transcriptional regulator
MFAGIARLSCAPICLTGIGVDGKKLFSFATSRRHFGMGVWWWQLCVSLYYGTASPMTSQTRPVYLRLRDEICTGILDGRYAEGTMLPSVRAFAAEQGANPLTVAKAYQQFQDEGLVTVQRGIGMFVSPGAVGNLRLRDEWPVLAARMRLLGLTMADLTEKA